MGIKLQRCRQQGIVLLAMMAILILIVGTLSIQFLNQSDLKKLKSQKTHQVLAEAKEAILAFSVNNLSIASSCSLNCPRPGDLPCPDLDNDGEAESSCNTQVQRLGRLPWKTLGLNDLRDGSGETLWYAVSEQYKNNTRLLPLNSDTLGTISLRNAQGSLIYDATTGSDSGLVALIIAPNDVLLRADNVQQNRANETDKINPKNYLDIAFGEDNSDFIDNGNNGFISGMIRNNNNVIVNDVILPVTITQIHAVMETRVLSEVRSALLSHGSYPAPASINDTTCLASESVNNNQCLSDQNNTLGRIPVGEAFSVEVNGSAEIQYRSLWELTNINSILKGSKNNNWFQQNGWRELILYARAKNGESLTLQNATTPSTVVSDENKQVVLLSASVPIHTQKRRTNNDKSNFSNYLEDENISPLNNDFSKYWTNKDRNDKAMSIP